MKIYTKTGDKGQTSLIGGRRLSKDNIRIEVYGTIDELNACLGTALSHLPLAIEDLRADLVHIQHQLFTVGAELATASDAKIKGMIIHQINKEDISFLEKKIDTYTKELPPLTAFILPGGTTAATSFHIARCVCRRAERRLVSLATKQSINNELIRFINRLSDFLFTAARLANRRANEPEIVWRKK